MATFAGRYSEDLQDRYGNGYRNAKVAVEAINGDPVTLYADRDKGAYDPAEGLEVNEIKADSRGNLIFFADPGNYQIVVTPVGGSPLTPFPIPVLPDPLEPDPSEDALESLQNELDLKADNTFAITERTGSFPQSVNDRFANLPTVSIKDFGADFGAIGDGVVRKVSAATVTAKTSEFGFSGAHRHDDLDAEDTEDWLAAALALKYLASKGGGTLHVPRPTVTYPMRRYLPIPTRVPIRILGDGVHPSITDFDNVYDLTLGGWHDVERRVSFQPGTFKLQALINGGTGASVQVAIAAVAVAYTSIIPLVTGGGATFAAGDRAVIYHTDTFTSAATQCPYRLCFRVVRAVSGDEIELDEPIPFPLPANKGRVAKMGTGSDNSAAGAPYDFIQDFVLDGISARGASLVAGGSAGRRCVLQNFRFRADRAAASTQNGGIQLNGWVDTVLRRFELLTVNRGVEVKAGSGGKWHHLPEEPDGGTGLAIEDGVVRQIGTDVADSPLLSIGEGSNAKLARCRVITGSGSANELLRNSGSEVLVVREITFDVRGGTDSTKSPFVITGHPAPLDRCISDIEGVRLGGDSNKYLRMYQASVTGDAPKMILYFGDLRVGVSIGGVFESTTFVGAGVEHGSVYDVRSEVGETLGQHASSTPVSPLRRVLGATATQIADATAWINTSYKQSGKSVYDTTNNRLYFPIGRLPTSNWRPLDDMSGGTDVTPS